MNMTDEKLIWKSTGKILILDTPILDVYSQHEISADGLEGDYISIHAVDWIMTIPVIDGNFVMVRQWRHAEQRLTTEFPGGMSEPGEDPEKAALRELEEETGFRAGKIRKLGTISPNPALFDNHVHLFIAEDLVQTSRQNLDEDEVLSYFLRPIDEVIAGFGNEEYSHALMGCALTFYLREKLQNR